jgi:hypothetical protein
LIFGTLIHIPDRFFKRGKPKRATINLIILKKMKKIILTCVMFIGLTAAVNAQKAVGTVDQQKPKTATAEHAKANGTAVSTSDTTSVSATGVSKKAVKKASCCKKGSATPCEKSTQPKSSATKQD